MILLGLLGLVVVIVLLLVVFSGANSSSPSSGAPGSGTGTIAKRPRHRSAPGAAAVKPAAVTVAVLNGTSVPNLAHATAARLGGTGFKASPAGNAANQTLSATVVGYLPGHRSDALVVAQSLKLGSPAVQPVDQSNQTLACPASSTPCAAQVVVAVGSDLANNT